MTLPLFEQKRPEHDRGASQWFTPAWLADRLVRWCGSLNLLHVLEPSAGSGALVTAAIRSLGPDEELGSITAFELDPRWALVLRDATRFLFEVDLAEADFLGEHRSLSLTYDLALMNPPYEEQRDVAFLRRAMSCSRRVAGIFRLAFLANRGTRAAIAERKHVLRRVAMLGRVRFDGDGATTPLSDFVAIETSLAKPGEMPGVDGATMEWWEEGR